MVALNAKSVMHGAFWFLFVLLHINIALFIKRHYHKEPSAPVHYSLSSSVSQERELSLPRGEKIPKERRQRKRGKQEQEETEAPQNDEKEFTLPTLLARQRERGEQKQEATEAPQNDEKEFTLPTLPVRQRERDVQEREATEAPKNAERNTRRTKLMLISNWRSGTSLTGDVFNHHSKVFYWYEPLLTIQRRYEENHSAAEFMDGRVLQYDRMLVPSILNEQLNRSMNCEFSSLYTKYLQSEVGRRNSLGFVKFSECLNKAKSRKLQIIVDCLHFLYSACGAATVVAAKVLRVTMASTRNYLETDPDVKVIFLVRDPRAVLFSMTYTTGLIEHTPYTPQTFCKKIGKDLEDASLLQKMFPSRVMVTRFEDVAEDPVHYFTHLLHFAGLKMEPALKEYIWNVTSSQQEVDKIHNFGVYRPDSKAAASKWRNDIPLDFALDVYNACGYAAAMAGYLPLPDENTLRNTNVPYFVKDYTRLPVKMWT